LKFLPYRPVDYARMAAIAFLYFGLAQIALGFLSIHKVAILWPSSGLGLAALLAFGNRLWPGVMLGAFASECVTGFSNLGIVLTTLGNTLEPVAAVWLTSRFGFNKSIPTLKDYFLLLFLAAIASTAISAGMGSVAALSAGITRWEALFGFVSRWWMGNMLGALLAVPLLVAGSISCRHPFRRAYEAALLLSLSLLFSAAVFLDYWHGAISNAAKAYWAFPLIIWAAVRIGTGGVSLVLLIIHAFCLWGVVKEAGYFGQDMAQTGLFNFWLFNVIIQVTGMSLATTLAEGEAATAILEHERLLLRENERRLREYLEFSPVPLGIFEAASQRILFLNRSFQVLFGYTQADIPDLAAWFQMAYPDPANRDKARKSWHELLEQSKLAGADSPQYETRIACKDGSERSVEVVAAPPDEHLLVAFHDITQKRRDKEVIWRQAHYDTLTELPNRRLFVDRLQEGIRQSRSEGLDLALLLIDLDRFKEVNDTLGHDVGDLLLVNAARRIVSCVGEGDTVARLGGDEFTVVLPKIAKPAQIESVARAIVNSMAEPFQLDHEQVFVSASIGITCCPGDGEDVKTLLKNADQALFETKGLGRNGFSYFTTALHEAAQNRLTMIRDLRLALSTGQLEVQYQPIIDLRSGAIAKAEALLRWHHPTRGLISPNHFIAVAEDIGLICEVGDWVFRQAAAQAKRIHDLGLSIQISVNKSARQFITGHTHESWVDFLHELGVPGHCIAIEITENLLLEDRPELLGKLGQFRAEGMQVCIDDFGTGYSSLSYLKKFDIDYLKIDRAFVRDLTCDPSDQALAEAIIVMSHKLGLKVIAEGVETLSQQDILAFAQCDYAQGYLYSQALPAAQFDEFVENWNKGEASHPAMAAIRKASPPVSAAA